jgi:hypothetical protein
MSTTESLRAAIDAFLTDTGMSATAFGLGALNDGKLVSRIRSGSDVTLRTSDRIHAYIAAERERMGKSDAKKRARAA